MKISRISALSGKTHTLDLDITQDQLEAWQSGKLLIQEAFPQLSNTEREFLLSGITEGEWEEVFGSIDDQDTEDFDETLHKFDYPNEN